MGLSSKKDKIRVLQVIGSLSGGGIQSLMLDIIEHCDKERFQIDVCEMADKEGYQADLTRSFGANVYQCSLRQNPITFKKRFGEILRNGNYDCIHVSRERLAAIPIWVAKSENISVRIAHFHNVPLKRHWLLSYSCLYPLFKKMILANATNIIGCSRDVLKKYFGNTQLDDRFLAIMNSVHYEKFSDNSHRQQIREELGIKPGELVVGTCGRLCPQKNPLLFVETAGKVADKIPNVKFLLVGDGPLRKKVEKLRAKLGLENIVVMPGWRDNISEMLSAMDVYYFPSEWEGFGIAVAEAQASGLPCVASDLGCFDESICPEMQEYIFPLKQSEKAVDKILFLLKNPAIRDELGRAGREFTKQFDVKIITQQIQDLYVQDDKFPSCNT